MFLFSSFSGVLDFTWVKFLQRMNQSSTPSPEKWLLLAQTWWCMPKISALERSGQENSLEFKARVRPCLKKPSKRSTNKQKPLHTDKYPI